jgi:hypothetical protein
LIKEFQNQVWNDEISKNNILSELAYDLDFYEPDSALRLHDHSYYGDEILEREINLALKKLKSNEG